MIDALASQSHYLEHLAPIWRALPDAHRGELCIPDQLTARAEQLRCPSITLGRQRPLAARVLVAAASDLGRLRGDTTAALLEHGAGQTYEGVDHVGYAGGRHRERVGLFLCPSPRVARLNLNRYPGASVAIVGCPRLDRLHRNRAITQLHRSGAPLIVVSFHWECSVAPEAGTAFGHWRNDLPGLRDYCTERGWQLVGHAHPRQREAPAWYRRHGIPTFETFAEVAAVASVYAVDNSSTLYEAAAIGLPVIALNDPAWRRDVHHGLRFWDQVPGPQADTYPELLMWLENFTDHPEIGAARRADVSAEVYAFRDGTATARAAEALIDWDSYPTP